MALCECGCGEILTGRQKRFRSDDHRARYWSNCRKAGALGKGLSALLPGKNKRPHCGSVSKSKRLRDTLAVVRELKTCTTLQIHERTGSCKPSTDVDDLRRAGYPVSMAKFVRTTENGRKVYEYTWEGKP